MNLITVEDDIVTRLNTISDIKAIAWGVDPTEYLKRYAGGVLLVRFENSTYSEPIPNNQPKIIQTRTLSYSVHIVTKSLKQTKTHQGGLTLIESVRSKLTGYTVTGFSDASVMYPTDDGFLSETAGFYLHVVNFEFTFPEAEA